MIVKEEEVVYVVGQCTTRKHTTPDANTTMSAVKHTHDLLLLDSSIRDWVVLPLLIIMIAAGLLRQFLSQYLRMKIKKVPKIECHVKSNLQRTSRLRCIGGGGAFLTQDKWEGRRGHTVIWLREQAEVVAEEDADSVVESSSSD